MCFLYGCFTYSFREQLNLRRIREFGIFSFGNNWEIFSTWQNLSFVYALYCYC